MVVKYKDRKHFGTMVVKYKDRKHFSTMVVIVGLKY